MAEGAEVVIDLTTSTAVKPQAEYFRRASAQELAILGDSIGQEAIRLAQEKGIKIDCLRFDYPDAKFALEVGDRVIEINILESSIKPAVKINFKALKYLGKGSDKKTSDEEELKPYLETEKTKLTKETMEFLRFTGEFVLTINPQCDVYIQPSSLRREQIYTKFLKPQEHPNIHILPSVLNDIKTKN